jgi:hypothetical protein
VSCDTSGSLVPSGAMVAYADCGPQGFIRFIGNDAGPLHALRTAPDGTQLRWWVDPDGVLPADERSRRAQCAKRAYFTRLAMTSAAARRKSACAKGVSAAA